MLPLCFCEINYFIKPLQILRFLLHFSITLLSGTKDAEMFLTNFLTYLTLIFAFAGCFLELYYIIAYIRSGFGKYPPFIASLGHTRKHMIEEAENFLKNKKDKTVVVDLGCGSGCLLIPLAKKFPQHTFIGYDWDYIPFGIAKFRCRKISNITLFRCSFMKVSHKNADLILYFGIMSLKEPLGKKLQSEIKPQTLVLSEAFPLNHLKLKKEKQTSACKIPLKIFIYTKNL